MKVPMILLPIGWLYGKIADVRNRLYDRGAFRTHDLGARTISIGNVTAGGTGKTPLVALVAEMLADSGERVCILTRGYGRENAQRRVLVSNGSKVLVDARAGGDEPVELAHKLLTRNVVVVADADRVSAAAWAKEKFGITAFVLDDGFQHRRAKRDLDIVCIDATEPFGRGLLLPAGKLREPLNNLNRADAVVITRSDIVQMEIERFADALTSLVRFVPATKEELDQWYSQAEQLKTDHLIAFHYVPHFFWHYLADADIRMKDEVCAEMHGRQIDSFLEQLNRPADVLKGAVQTESPRARTFLTRIEIVGLRRLDEFAIVENEDEKLRVLAFCGLGNPDAFFAQLELAAPDAFDVSLTYIFPDHHRYTQADVSILEEKARNAGGNALLCTAKDAVKLKGLTFGLPCYVVEIEVRLDDPAAFRDLVLSA